MKYVTRKKFLALCAASDAQFGGRPLAYFWHKRVRHNLWKCWDWLTHG